MNKILVVLTVFIGLSFNASSQNKDKEEIKKVVEIIIELTENGDYNKTLDYTYPKLFTLVSRAVIEQQFDKIFTNNDELKVTMDEFSMGEVSDIKKGVTAEYAVLPYNYILRMQYLSPDLDSTVIEFTSSMLIGQFGKENVSADYDSKTIIIVNKSRMLAIKDNGTADWKVIELKAEQMSLLALIIPKDIYQSIL